MNVIASGAGGDRVVGRVTSGCLSPTLDMPIGMAIVDMDIAETMPALMVDLGRERAEAAVYQLPFYNPTKPGKSAT
jgi:aminomethyltransferase